MELMSVRFRSCFHEKRYILDDDINIMAYFHNDVKKSMRDVNAK